MNIETTVRLLPPGRRFQVLMVALFKWLAIAPAAKDMDRLEALEQLHAMVDEWMTPQRLAMISPASRVEIEMITAAENLDGRLKRRKHAFDLLTKPDTFILFARANAGMRQALALNAVEVPNAV